MNIWPTLISRFKHAIKHHKLEENGTFVPHASQYLSKLFSEVLIITAIEKIALMKSLNGKRLIAGCPYFCPKKVE